jgi:hypothetical protein
LKTPTFSTDLPPARSVFGPGSSLVGMDMTETRIRKAGPPDLIATIWFRLGFVPRESLVIARLDGPRQEIGSAARVDLPPPGLGRPGQRAALRSALDPLASSTPEARGPATAVAAVIASEQALDPPAPRILPVLRREVRRRGLKLVDVVGVTSTAYRSLDCPDRRCCPRSGRSLEEVLSSRAAMAYVLNGATLAPTEQGVIADVRPSPAAAHLARAAPVPLTRAERRGWWRRWVTGFEATREGVPDPAIDLTGLAGALHDPDLRDRVLMDLLGVDPSVLPSWLAGGWWGEALWDGGGMPGDPGVRGDAGMRGDAGPVGGVGGVSGVGMVDGEEHRKPPDEDRLRNGEATLAAVVRTAAPGDRGPALALMAMVAWYLGRNSRSRLLLEQALADGRPPALAGLVGNLLRGHHRPPWLGPVS